jgi:aromatic-L-amino-acid decarboxylase
MNDSHSKWNWPPEEIRRVGYRVVDIIADHLTTLPMRPVFHPVPMDVARRLQNEPMPVHGQDANEVLEAFLRHVEPYPFGNGHPRFFGWVNSPPALMGIFAEALAAAMNPSCAGGNHAAVFVERQVADWFKQLLSFPADSFGLIVSGGSMAALTALAVARHAKLRLRRAGPTASADACSVALLQGRRRPRLSSEGARVVGNWLGSHSTRSA